jgi:D-3-phosphoglycerate dehydrogenase
MHGVVGSAVNLPSISADDAGVLVPYIRLGECIGSLHAQLEGRAPERVQIQFHGDVAGVDTRPVTAAVLKGLLERVVEPPVNTVNAPLLAADRGIKVTDLRDAKPAGFANSVRVVFESSKGKRVIEGAVFGQDVIRIVRFDDFHFELAPAGIILVLHNRDVPGVVGNVGTFLASQGVNIAGFSLGRVGGEAVSFVHVDSALEAAQLEQLRRLPDITGASMVRFD